ncbi:C-type lectin domain-containing protein [Caenorhabditis elegans]|uniref:C-type lectin domain-containing protein n=1 Tax=Caenorhabditis elegans TaxID=6239 RepID=Q1ZXU1_CAEEL|nr:C-type lectin domain-containing protein [Caenorhabditis elegans]CAJ85784.2 C-type lectin domain-containing protein [Caenorhabditis elegans]|eukprot:NP_001041207.2 C-type LECtin [Caenorhabditis elegans]
MKRFQVFIYFCAYILVVSSASAKLDLGSIKKQQTYPSGTGTTISTSVSTVEPCNVGCQNGWVPYGGNCYRKMVDVLTQESAEQECVELGAHLASFETTDEATSVKNLVLSSPLFSDDLLSFTSSSQETWIGLSKTNNGAWKWVNSSDVDFTNLPDGTTVNGASCVSMNISGIWQPKECTSTASSFICKRTAASQI